jgi:IS4 transposase
VVDVTQKGAYVASVEQTLPAPKSEKGQSDVTRLDQAIKQMQTVRPHLPQVVRHLAAEGWYANYKYIDAATSVGLHVVTKLRSDANMRFSYTGERTGKRGRPRIYGGKIDWQDLSRFDQVKVSTLASEIGPGIEVYTAELYHLSVKRWMRTVVLVWHTADGKRHHAILATTDLTATVDDVLRIYQARFQLEFLFRDGKQHAGLTECQARNKEALDFHFNAALATVSTARAAALSAQVDMERNLLICDSRHEKTTTLSKCDLTTLRR